MEFIIYNNSFENISKNLDVKQLSIGNVSIQKNKQKEIKNLFSIDLLLTNKNYRDLEIKNGLIYLDPPYLSSKHLYSGWNEKDEIELLEWIRNKDKEGNDFVLSNVSNKFIDEFKKDFNYIEFEKNYKSFGNFVNSYKELIVSNLDINSLLEDKKIF